MDLNREQEEKFEQLYMEMEPLLFTYAKGVLNNRSIAEDAVQETFCIACNKAEDLLQSENPQGWLLEALKHVLQNKKKSYAATKDMVKSMAEDDELEKIGVEDELPLDVLYEDITATEDYKLVAQVTFENKTISELSEELGINADTCRKRIRRAKRRLKEKFKNFQE